MSPERPENWIALLHVLADCADAIALRRFRCPGLAAVRKEDGSPVTQADLEIEREVVARTQVLAPGLAVLGEEYGVRPGTGEARLILDPIDATANFVQGSPVFATLLAIQVGHRIIAGMASAPALHHRWWASQGNGAFRDGEPLRVSDRLRLADCRLFHGTPTEPATLARYPAVPALLRATKPDRETGDFLQHLRVAEGRGEVAVDLDVEPWDVAALKIIVEEAGGRATAADGSDRIDAGTLVCTNGRVHEAVLTFLHRAPDAPQGARQAPAEAPAA